MCGIGGIYLKNPDEQYLSHKEIETVVDWLYCGLEARGNHATGLAVQDKYGIDTLEKSDMPASKFIFWRRDIMPDPRIILLHTRFATKGKPENLLNNHPIAYKNITAVHNGHISNDDELFIEEELDRIAEVDSEIIPALLHKYTFDDPKTALEKMSGGFAISAFDARNPGSLLLAKGQSSPLVYLENSGMIIWASEQGILRDALQYGMGYEAKDDEFKIMPYGTFHLINGEEKIVEDFKPYTKTYTYTAWDRTKNTTVIPSHQAGDYYGVNSRDKCDECFVWFPTYQLNRIGVDRYCDHCEAKLFDIDESGMRIPKPKRTKKLSRKERKKLRKEAQRRFQEEKNERKPKEEPKTIADALDNEHWVVCQLVAEFYGTNPELVDFLIFSDQDVEDFEDPNLVTMYLEFEEKYKDILDEIRGETDVLIERMAAQKTFPVGF